MTERNASRNESVEFMSVSVLRFPDSLSLHCGLCVSGQTISDCTRALRNISTISNRVVISLGSVDIYNVSKSDFMLTLIFCD